MSDRLHVDRSGRTLAELNLAAHHLDKYLTPELLMLLEKYIGIL